MSKSPNPPPLSPTLIIHIIRSYRFESNEKKLSKHSVNNLIEAAVKNGVLDDATQLFIEAERNGTFVHSRIQRYLMSALVSSGDIKAIRTIGETLSEVSFELCLNLFITPIICYSYSAKKSSSELRKSPCCCHRMRSCRCGRLR